MSAVTPDVAAQQQQQQPSSARPLEVIFENAEMLVVNKPADVPMDGDTTTYEHTVESMVSAHMRSRGIFDEAHEQLQREGKRKKQLKFVHQLDYSTSGVLCLAVTKDMAARLAHCFEMRTTRKYYVALLRGHIPSGEPTRAVEGNVTPPPPPPPSSPFAEWVTRCQQVWQDVGSVQVDSCPAFPAETNRAALDEYCHLLYSNAATKTEQGDVPQPTVHRHRGPFSSSGLSLGETADHHSCGPSGSIEQIIAEASASATACSLTVSLPVGYDPADAAHFRMAVTTEQSRPASTSLLILRRTYLKTTATASALRSEDDTSSTPVTLVLLSPHTGRRHQLRVHCRALGFPIVGDAAYCTDLPWCRLDAASVTMHTGWGLSPRRMYLHAWRLVLPGAVTTHASEFERVAQKKKRRRETLGLADQVSAAVSGGGAEWTEFVAPIDFPDVVLESVVVEEGGSECEGVLTNTEHVV